MDSVAWKENTIQRVQDAHRVKYKTLRIQKTAHKAEVKKHSDDLLAADALVTNVCNKIDMAKQVDKILLEEDKSSASSSANQFISTLTIKHSRQRHCTQEKNQLTFRYQRTWKIKITYNLNHHI